VATRERRQCSSRRRYATGAAAGIVVATVSFAWLVTGGTFQLLQRNLYANFYDVQARALFHGHWNMPASTLTVEGIREGGRTYMYYGPVPAILRMPVLALTHRFDGRLSACSMLVAFVVALVFLASLGWRIRALVTDAPVAWIEAVTTGVILALAGVGSILFFLGSDAIIYHEAELWGAAFALGAFDFIVGWLGAPRARPLLLAGLFATLALLTRGSVGAGPVACLGLMGLACGACSAFGWLGRRRGQVGDRARQWCESLLRRLGLPPLSRPGVWALGLLVAAAIPVALYVAINEVKFGTLFSLPLDKQVFTLVNRNRQRTLADNGGSLFGLKFVPTALVQYLRPDALRFVRLFPFVAFPPPATVIGRVHYDTLDFASSITASMPAISLLSAVGLVAVVRGRQGALGRLRLPAAGAAVGTAGVLSIAYIANRYLADMVPLLALLALAGFHRLRAGWMNWPRWWRRLARAGLCVLAVFGVWVNVGLALLYQRELRPSVPIAMREGFVAFQQRLDVDLFGGRGTEVRVVRALGRPGPPGSFAIVGHCVGLYQSNGSSWAAVERSRAGGHVMLRVVFPDRGPGRPWPVLVNGTPGNGDYLVVDPLAPGRVRFGYWFQGYGQGWVYGPAVSVVPGRSYRLDVVFDPRLPQVSAHLDGASVLLARLVRPASPLDVGTDPIGGPTLGRFPGTITQLPVATPVCDALLRRARVDSGR